MDAVAHVTTLRALRNAAAPVDREVPAAAARGERTRGALPALSIDICSDLTAIEAQWRRFERVADCTAFQAYDWLATWYRHVGCRDGVRPAIVVGRFGDGDIAFMLPLAVEPRRFAKRLCWLGEGLCDYNAPLLARDFSLRVSRDCFLAAWTTVRERLQADPLLRHDWIELEKMPEMIGPQRNPFTYLPVAGNPSGAHLTHLGDDWPTFYAAKRSSSTRRRDRAKQKHLSEFGEIRFVTATDPADARRTLEILMEQKSRSLARRGIADIFARPGHREFFIDLASRTNARDAIHISRLDIGTTCAAVNLGAVLGDCYYHVLASYNEESELARFGPGAMHLHELLAYAIRLGLKRFDFTIGDEPYKLKWSDTDLKLYDYTVAADWRGWPALAASNARRPVKRFIKQTPVAWRLVSDLRSALGSLGSLPLLSRWLEQHPRAAAGSEARPAPACVIGDMDLLRPVAMAAIPCAVVTRPGVPSLYARAARARLRWDDFSADTEELLAALETYGRRQHERPVLFYEEDAQLIMVSRFRERLAQTFRFVVADASLVEDLLDKGRFQNLAERHGLPVPAARRFDPAALEPGDLGLSFPLIVKPLTRLGPWNEAFGLRKALCAESADALRQLWPQLRTLGLELLAQEFIPGAEAQMESYHCYVDQRGGIAGEFTGRKIRTYPLRYGHTTALEITQAADVQQQGRAIVERLALTGVAKLDFKRDPQGKLHLLEINPRFNLWHHAGAVAGVNIPALVYADLAGLPRPPATCAKPGVRWCRPWKDFSAARAGGLSLATWLSWVVGCEAKSALSWDDPALILRAGLHRSAMRYLGRERAVAATERHWVSS